jgi:ATP-dependent DNA ligase
MKLALKPPLSPMEAELVENIPVGQEWQYEPKWDGFRCLVFRDDKTLSLQSKSGQPLTRYFPELVAALERLRAKRFVLDGEIVVPVGKQLSFDQLLQRIHPAASRVKMLSEKHPAMLIVFDLLADERGKSLLELPLAERRERLEAFADRYLGDHEQIHLSPATTRVTTARKWFEGAGGALDGVVAKRRDLAYQAGERTGMQKIKPIRTADCVVGGFRYASKGKLIGSLLLGLYNDEGLLDHVGYTSSFKETQRKEITRLVKQHIKPPGFTGKAPGGPSRWSTKRSTEWTPLAPDLVVEVEYDQFSAGRFRHGTQLMRWRPDKAARACTIDQVKPHRGGLRLLAKRARQRAK